MQAFLKALPKDAISDLPIKVADVGGSRVGIYGVFRPKSMPGDAIAHETRTAEVYYILDGAGTLVTGGTIADPKPPPAGRTAGPRGDRIIGGVTPARVRGGHHRHSRAHAALVQRPRERHPLSDRPRGSG